MDIPQIPSNPFKKIGLSCSGGGYRAASYNLGALSYLNKLSFDKGTLLDKVKMISTVSGGTITGAIYALQKQEGKTFQQIYDFIMHQLRYTDLVKLGIEKLKQTGNWNNAGKQKNLINAFAELYDDNFTHGALMNRFDTMNSHLEAICFNSTEFNNGIHFRFRNKGREIFGNKYNKVPSDAGSEIKVADAIAASSCFPGGFEPMIWPGDFLHKQSRVLDRIKEEFVVTGLMDGGIYDNQGIISLLLYKASKGPYFDLLIISDVTSPYMTPYKPTASKDEIVKSVPGKKGWKDITIGLLKNKIRRRSSGINYLLLGIAVLFSLIPLKDGYALVFNNGLFVGIAFGFFLLWITKIILTSILQRQGELLIKKIVSYIPEFYFDRLSRLNFNALSANRAGPLLLDRINSLITLLLDVFLKVVRRLNYEKVYGDDRWQYRRMSNLIHELTPKDFKEARSRRPNDPNPGPLLQEKSVLKGNYDNVVGEKIQKVAELASSFGTTLWFTKDEELNQMLDNLVACGQLTLCYNLIEYIERLIYEPGNGYELLPEDERRDIENLYNQCVTDWKKFKNDPFCMVHELNKVAGTKNYKTV